jgi:hypothetical protein
MDGAARRHKRELDVAISCAWHSVVFEAKAQKGRLKKLSEYLEVKAKPRKRQTPEEMFAILSQFQAGGAPIDIREVN